MKQLSGHLFGGRMTNRNAISRTLAIILFNFISADSMAGNFPKSESEFSILPAYCKARLGPGKGLYVPDSEIKKWQQVLGPGFAHVHHFCAGLNTMNKISKGVPSKNRLNSVLQEFEYTQKHTGKNFPLQPKISLEKGKVLLQLNRNAEAISEFRIAIQLKPTYTPPYVELSEYYVKTGRPDQAETILKEGLKHSPNSKSLKRRLTKLQ